MLYTFINLIKVNKEREARKLPITPLSLHAVFYGPPGTGCPVIASLSGVDLAVIVTEPTVSGVHDLERVLLLAEHFRVDAMVVINKADLNKDQVERIYKLAKENGAEVIAKIPFDDNVLDALKEGKTVIEYNDQAPASKIIKEIYKKITH